MRRRSNYSTVSRQRLLWVFAAIVGGGVLDYPIGAWADSDLRKDQVPEAVIQRFKQDYPKARTIEYELETDDGQRIYEIEFKVGRRKVKAAYREDGTAVSNQPQRLDDDD
jgi:hypothetical protein